MQITPAIVVDLGLFRCERLAATITKKSCIAQYLAASSVGVTVGGKISEKWIISVKRLSPCRTCHVGQAHAAGSPTPAWACNRCGGRIGINGCAPCNDIQEKQIRARMSVVEETPSAKDYSVQRNCKKCGKLFTIAHSMHLYCSLDCKLRSGRKRVYSKKPPVIAKCIVCGKEFERYKAKKMCSPECVYVRARKSMYLQREIDRQEKREALGLNNRPCENPLCSNTYDSANLSRKYCNVCMKASKREKMKWLRYRKEAE